MIFRATSEDAPAIIAVAERAWDATYRDILSAEQYDYMLERFYALSAIQETLDTGEQFFFCTGRKQR